MGKLGQSSFRRILFSRILLLIIPVLFAGEYVVYRKVRSSALESARQNLTQTAAHQAEDIRMMTETIQSSLWIASDALTDYLDRPQEIDAAVQKLQRQLPPMVECIQVTSLKTEQLESSTCGLQPIQPIRELNIKQWQIDRSKLAIAPPRMVISTSAIQPGQTKPTQHLLRFAFSAPLYDRTGDLRYVLSAQSVLRPYSLQNPPASTEAPWIVAQDGRLVFQPHRTQASLGQLPPNETLHPILNQAIAGKSQTQQMISQVMSREGEEKLVGYSPVRVILPSGKPETWVIFAILPIDEALYDLRDIKLVLVTLTLGLVGASLLATIYIARNLANPVEKLGKYALQIGGDEATLATNRLTALRSLEPFRIRELDQLATVLNNMVHRLQDRAEELETAWQEAKAANQHKTDFLAITSHELRTPLGKIINCVQLVRDGDCNDRQEELEFLQHADEAAKHLLRVSNDLLDISKIEAGKVELNRQPVAIIPLCQQCIRMVQSQADSKQLHLSLNVDPALQEDATQDDPMGDRLLLDEKRISQMLINLLSNAIKFTPPGGTVELSASLTPTSLPSHLPNPHNVPPAHLCLQVSDTGIGIPKDRWHLLFRPFQQIDPHIHNQGGTGLGLALTKRLAELHGGTLTFDSTPGKGSTFRFCVPTAQ
jgi:signal transduction histidine kinase